MSNIVALRKILDLRNEEKNNALLEQKEAIDYFEKVAEQLYIKLKTKEDAESRLQQMYKGSEVIFKIREQTLYIESLQQKINTLQREVQLARQRMEEKQHLVTEKHVELKKIETMIEKREEALRKEEEQEETRQMDEISLNRYIRAE
ncbi:MAG TPA: flagellar export protein FliJ [Pseudogracilibacillus sp.]|nr:flagellar export protein FliJ [Pseudogracilibacillus sp.]